MKIACLILFAVIGLSLNIKAQTLPTRSEQYQFLKWYIDYKKPTHLQRFSGLITLGEIHSGDQEEIKKLIKYNKDRQYLNRQIAVHKMSVALDSTILKGVSWKPDTEKEQPFSRLSLPIFSRNRKLVFVNYEYSNIVSGTGNAEYGIEVYVKERPGVWRLCGLNPFHRIEEVSIAD